MNEVPEYLIRTVESVARRAVEKHKLSGMTYDDFYSIAIFSVLQAIPKYSPGRGSINGFCWTTATRDIKDKVKDFDGSRSWYFKGTENKAFFEGHERITTWTPHDDMQVKDLVDYLFHGLSRKDKVIARRYWILEQSATEIGKELGIHVWNIKTRLKFIRMIMIPRAQEYVNAE